MSKYKFNYIITLSNNKELMQRALSGVFNCAGRDSGIYLILDGSDGDFEAGVDKVISDNKEQQIVKFVTAGIGHIPSVNMALSQISQVGDGFNIILRDADIMIDVKLEEKISAIYDEIGYKNVGLVTFQFGANIVLNQRQAELSEIDLIESVHGAGLAPDLLPSNNLVERMVSFGAMSCLSFEVIKKIGTYDEALAPATYENHDLSLRCLVAGYRNFVFALPFELVIEPGNISNESGRDIQVRNRRYLYQKHYNFLTNFIGINDFDKLWLAKPFKLNNSFFADSGSELLAIYASKRRAMVGGIMKRLCLDLIRVRGRKLLLNYLRLNKYQAYKQLMRLIAAFGSHDASGWKKISDKMFGRTKKWSESQDYVKGTTEKETAVLKKYASLAKIGIIEIGVLDGGTTKEFSQYATAPIYGIDPIIPDSMDNSVMGHEDKIKRNMAHYAKFRFFQDFSYNLVGAWSEKFDFIFIDGDHTYEGIKRDFNDWFPLLEKGGYIAFHDSAVRTSAPYSFSGWSGPKKLVSEIRNMKEISFLETADSVTVFQKLD